MAVTADWLASGCWVAVRAGVEKGLAPRPSASNDGDLRPYYASADLRRYMEKHRPSYRLPDLPDFSPEQEALTSAEAPVTDGE